jgi:hypothetical protein
MSADTKKRPVGRPRKDQAQSYEDRQAWVREYNQRPEVIERRRAYQRAYYPTYHKERRARETPEEREDRLAYNRFYLAQRRAEETPEEREDRLAKARDWYHAKRAKETPEEREIRRAKRRAAYHRRKKMKQ